MRTRWMNFVTWFAVGASVVAWALPMLQPPTPLPVNAQVAQQAPARGGDWDRVLMAQPVSADPSAAAAAAAAADASRFRLIGLAANKVSDGDARAGKGLALIAVDDKPARAFRAGDVIDGQRVVQSVNANSVKIGMPQGPALITLQAPLLPGPATGSLPPVAASARP